jgi:hypothetical protein
LIETGNRLKLATGAFSLMALMALAYSGNKLSLLYDTPLVSASLESKLAKKKWNELEKLVSVKKTIDWSESIGQLIIGFTKPKDIEEKTISSQEIQQVVRYIKEKPPEISGIIITSGSLNKSNASVVIQGNIYTENDVVSGFMIKKITENGVSLTKNGRHYFIDAPKAPYSLDQGN